MAMQKSEKRSKESLSDMVNRDMSLKEQLLLTIRLSMPSIMAQLSTIVMQYIDAAMVGSLGANASASIGLMMAPIWLFTGIIITSVAGFSVQTAHLLGAKDEVNARRVVRQSYVVMLTFSMIVGLIACICAPFLPAFLGGAEEIRQDSTDYLIFFMGAAPLFLLNYLSAAMLRTSGNMLLPGMLNMLMCILDVVFNFFFIFETKVRTIPLIGEVETFGLGLGVKGAALGSAAAAGVIGCILTYFLVFRSPTLALIKDRGSFKPTLDVVRRALRISIPITGQQFMLSSAQLVSTMIVAPLGTVAIAAHAFANTIEAICYMPGFGVSDAATTLVGQSVGARRFDLTRRFAAITILLGVAIMSFMAVLMYVFSPEIMAVMTPDHEVRSLAVTVLRIEAFAEPMFACAIVAYGVCVGAGDTFLPSIINFGTIWVIRLGLAYYLSLSYGLEGVWIAMAIELSIRGLLMVSRVIFGKWIKVDNLAS